MQEISEIMKKARDREQWRGSGGCLLGTHLCAKKDLNHLKALII